MKSFNSNMKTYTIEIMIVQYGVKFESTKIFDT